MRDYKTSIVIPLYKGWSLCHNLLNCLRKHEKENIDEVIVVDDNSQDADIDGGLDFWIKANLFPVRVIQNDQNLGFTLTSNRGLKEATENFSEKRIVFLISSDVSIGGKFIQQTADLLLGARKTFVGHKLLFGDTGWNTFDGKTFQYLEGYFLAATSFGWHDLGFFDVNYAPYDYEDIDISTTAKKKGYQLVPLNIPTIVHKGGGTIGYNPERQKITERNREYFKNKWMK